uniref:SFRICE_033535 n=1 Tax=Spodoptera frugiperda TaxID=7108 RepID=A0A2H1VI85_SPOFR
MVSNRRRPWTLETPEALQVRYRLLRVRNLRVVVWEWGWGRLGRANLRRANVYVTELLLNDWTDFDEIFCVCSRGSENGLDSQFCPLANGVDFGMFYIGSDTFSN